jgi:RNA polymerase sigma factor (TIGR02999 family)
VSNTSETDLAEVVADLERADLHEPGVESLLPQLYDDLRRMAHGQLRRERRGHTLDTTALVHESYLRLAKQEQGTFNDRAHFLSVAAMIMRRVLINYARARAAQKRGGGARMVTFEDQVMGPPVDPEELLALDLVLEELVAHNPRHGHTVILRFYGGLTFEEIADVLKISVPTVRRDWRFARAWLMKQLGGAP